MTYLRSLHDDAKHLVQASKPDIDLLDSVDIPRIQGDIRITVTVFVLVQPHRVIGEGALKRNLDPVVC